MSTGDLTKDFSRHEFACKCGCGGNTIDHETLIHLQYERTYFNRRMVITSGYRCPEYNRQVGGADDSQHLCGRAADSWMEEITPEERYDYYQKRWPRRYGIGVYVAKNFIHLDTRSNGPARWTGEGDTFQL